MWSFTSPWQSDSGCKKFIHHYIKLYIRIDCACCGQCFGEGLRLFLPFTNPSLSLTQDTRIYLSESLQLIDPRHVLTAGYAAAVAAVTTLQTVLQQNS
jgi:hypothetical protein